MVVPDNVKEFVVMESVLTQGIAVMTVLHWECNK